MQWENWLDFIHATKPDQFGEAELDVAKLFHQPFFGPDRFKIYGNSYERNYKKTTGPRMTTAWHLVEVKSLLTQEVVTLDYIPQNGLTYYSDKSYTHSFPNFNPNEDGTKLITNPNNDLNPEGFTKTTKWENGRAEFAYSVTQTFLDRWDLIQINTLPEREEQVVFSYSSNEPAEDAPEFETYERGEIDGDHLCNLIRVYRSGGFYKGWFLEYSESENVPVASDCTPGPLTQGPPQITIEGDTEFSLAQRYSLTQSEYYSYFFINFSIGCFKLPIRLALPYDPKLKDFGFKTEMHEFGSLMDVKGLLGEFGKTKEDKIFNAERKRTFLSSIQEVDQDIQLFPFVRVSYHDGFALPKRYSLDQNGFGYYINNSESGSPFAPIEYTSIDNNTINTETSEVSLLFGFENRSAPGKIHEGRVFGIDKDLAKMGAVKEIGLSSGGKFVFHYEPHSPIASGDVPGFRVNKLIQDPANSPEKVTDYLYSDPTIVNSPIFIYQNVDDYYYRGLEQRVVCTSSSQNPLVQNKNGYMGYGEVAEVFNPDLGDENGDGKVIHYFTTPLNFTDKIDFLETTDFTNSGGTWWFKEKNKGLAIPSEFFKDENPGFSFPPALESTHFTPWFWGLEHKTEVLDNQEQMLQSIENEFSIARPGSQGSIMFFKSHQYQNNYPGHFMKHYGFRLIRNYKPFKGDAFEELLTYLAGLILETISSHAFKEVDRYYFIQDFRLSSSNVVQTSSNTKNFFSTVGGYSDGGENQTVQTTYTYNNHLIPKEITTTYSGGTSTKAVNVFADDQGIPEITDYFETKAITYLNSLNYRQPIFSKSYLNGNLVKEDITGLDKLGDSGDERIVPISNWTLRDGVLKLAGVFYGYDTNDKPQNYYLAKFEAQMTNELSELNNTQFFFSPIELSWNDQLQLESRTYEDFTTTYGYNDFFELMSMSNPDGIQTLYSYDKRGRPANTTALNGRQITTYSYKQMFDDGENSLQTTLSFSDGLYPDQGHTEYYDGFGKPLETIRNDGNTLSKAGYDHFFRTVSTYQMGKGTTQISHNKAPIPRRTEVIDAENNITTSIQSDDDLFFAATYIKDPNDHVSVTYSDGIGRTQKTVTAYGELDIETEYGYDPLGRLSAITNPIEEAYSYQYNPIDRPYSIKIPGVTGLKETWWDKAYRPIATRDAEGNTLLYRYDIYNRLTHVYTASAGASLGNSSEMKPENAFSSFEDELLLENTYALDHTWLQMSTERILTSNGFGGNKVTDNTDQGNGTIDDLGRPEKIRVSYPDGVMISMPTYTDAMLVPYTQTNITGPDNQAIDLEYTFGFDDLLRPENTYLNVNSSGSQLISELVYNEVDQVKIKYLGDYLQEINYLYDKTGRLTHINSRGQMECFEDLTICALEFEKSYDISQAGEPLCSYLEAIQVDGQVYTFPDILYLTPSGLSDLYDVDEELENYIQEGLDYFGLMGEVTVEQNVVEGQQVDYTIFIQNTNTDQVSLHFTSTSCTQIVAFTVVSCCEVEGQSGGGGSSNTLVESPDLYFQENTFSGLDISRIEIGSDCITGFMANDYTYDSNHRLTQMDNTLYNPSPQTGSYSTQYTYDDAGNILTLKRRGLVPPLSSPPVYGAIDELTYSYNDPLNPQEKSRVQSIIDAVTDPNAQPEGFKGNQNPGDAIPDKASTFEYDKNGNLIYDGGKELTIDYNLLNLPRLVSHSGSGNSIQLDYAFGGEKIRKISPEGTRIYLGGVEYLDNSPESLTHSDGRVDLSGAGGPKHQFSIKDHLGNTAVLFEDANNDGAVFSSEVLQRNLYYPFGLELKGEWNSATSPRMDYLYNGKEFNEELELNWLDYGFRWYDPAVGRFPSVRSVGGAKKLGVSV
jgi:RHS repeat-associated protein